MWTKDGDAPGPGACNPGITMNTTDALTYVACLNINAYAGHTDWRLPNVNELASLVNRGAQSPETGASWLNSQGFTNVKPAWYRSSTTNASDTSYAWVVNIGNGNIFSDGPKSGADHVWPVRDSQPGQ
jgi:hypothetical protein